MVAPSTPIHAAAQGARRLAVMSTGRAKARTQARRQQTQHLAQYIREQSLRQFGEWHRGAWVLKPLGASADSHVAPA